VDAHVAKSQSSNRNMIQRPPFVFQGTHRSSFATARGPRPRSKQKRPLMRVKNMSRPRMIFGIKNVNSI